VAGDWTPLEAGAVGASGDANSAPQWLQMLLPSLTFPQFGQIIHATSLGNRPLQYIKLKSEGSASPIDEGMLAQNNMASRLGKSSQLVVIVKKRPLAACHITANRMKLGTVSTRL
jgi:hypothetical protein